MSFRYGISGWRPARHTFAAFALASLVVVAAACGGSDGDEPTSTPTPEVAETATSTPTLEPTPTATAVPDGWTAFSNERFTGIARTVWYVGDIESGDLLRGLDDVPPEFAEPARNLLEPGTLDEATVIFLDGLGSNVLLLECIRGVGGATRAALEDLYEAEGLGAEYVQDVTFQDALWPLFQFELREDVGSYQVAIQQHDCTTFVVLTNPGGADNFDFFLTFLEALEMLPPE